MQPCSIIIKDYKYNDQTDVNNQSGRKERKLSYVVKTITRIQLANRKDMLFFCTSQYILFKAGIPHEYAACI